MILSDDMVIYPGHGRETTIGAERRDNPYVTGKSGYSYW
jgi:glyoxylase-like metal-dependent hydrolase (beta-lactamase superfamily II)